VSVLIETFGTERAGRDLIEALVSEHFDLRPAAFRGYLDLHRPIYSPTSAYGHFGRTDVDLPWEHTDRADALRRAAGLSDFDAPPAAVMASVSV
jgi:S-adenosylmethionine synthetase